MICVLEVGCIAISLAKYVDNSIVDAVDISEKALSIAKVNAKKNKVCVNFIKSNLFKEIDEKYDVIISNPPYIKTDDLKLLQDEVKNEPVKALDGGIDGLYFYKKIINEAKKYLKSNGVLALEIGFNQAIEVSKLLKENKYSNIKIIKDLSKNDRCILAEIE